MWPPSAANKVSNTVPRTPGKYTFSKVYLLFGVRKSEAGGHPKQHYGSDRPYKGKCSDFARRRRENFCDLGAYTRGNALILLAAGAKILDLKPLFIPPVYFKSQHLR